MTIQLYIMKVCKNLLNQYIHINKINDEFFANNMVIYIEEEKKKLKILIFIQLYELKYIKK